MHPIYLKVLLSSSMFGLHSKRQGRIIEWYSIISSLTENDVDCQILFIFLKFAAILPIFIFVPSSTLPFALITLPSYLNFSTDSTGLPSTLIWLFLMLSCWCITTAFVLSCLIFSICGRFF